MKLHTHQKELLNFLKKQGGDLRKMSLRDIGEAIGIKDRAQVISHHLQQLENKGFIRRVKPNERYFEVLKHPADEVVYVDLYRTTAQCGPDGFLGDDMVIDHIPLSSKTFSITNPDNYFLIKSRGASMEPMIKENDLILAHKQDDIDSGEVAVVVHDGIPKIKKVLKIKVDGEFHYLLKSLSSSFDDEEIADKSSGFRVCGRVKAIIKMQ